ncbi:helicase-primase helicase subunit [Silurid herpesvirus 1]|nr:helicase-primase helicase subunit [Silurid herpesvirus 1]
MDDQKDTTILTPPEAPRTLSPQMKGYAGFVQTEWVRGVLNYWMMEPRGGAIVLSGDAGCGKSHALRELVERVRELGLEECLNMTATTHKAVGVLDYPGCSTYQSSLMYNLDMCQATFDEFKTLFDGRLGHAIDMWERIVRNRRSLVTARKGHECESLNTRCTTCVSIMREALNTSGRMIPFFPGRTIFVIDEYGILSELSLKKILYALSKFTFDDQGYLLIFTGSVSQLPSPESPQIWQTELFNRMINHTYSLFINFRVDDVEYADAMNMFQFNIVTRPALEILTDREIGELAYDPEYRDEVTRVFNGNRERDAYNQRYGVMMEKRGAEKRVLTPIITNRGGNDRCSFKELIEYISTSAPKIFTKTNRGVRTVYLGGSVFVLPEQQKHTLIGFAEGDEHVILEKDGFEIYMERIVTHHKNWTVVYWPIFPVAAINTYSAQGETMDHVIYAPPEKNYQMSSIKASAYVACTRVRNRNCLELSCNSFAKRVGRTQMFPTNLLLHKKELEMGYIRKK